MFQLDGKAHRTARNGRGLHTCHGPGVACQPTLLLLAPMHTCAVEPRPDAQDGAAKPPSATVLTPARRPPGVWTYPKEARERGASLLRASAIRQQPYT